MIGTTMNTTTVTVYSTPACPQCRMTYRALDNAGISYNVIDLADDANAAAREWVTDDLGYSQAPVVVVDDETHWSGFRPDRIATLTERNSTMPEQHIPDAPETGFFNTDMANVEGDQVAFNSHRSSDGLFITSIGSEDGTEIGRVTYGPMRKLTDAETRDVLTNAWGDPSRDLQDGEVFEGDNTNGITILARIGTDYYLGTEAPATPQPAAEGAEPAPPALDLAALCRVTSTQRSGISAHRAPTQ